MNTTKPDFRHIVDQYSDRIYNHAVRFLGSRENAEDALQEIFIRIYKNLDQFKGDSDIYTWIYRITVNVCLSIASKTKKYSFIVTEDDDDIQRVDNYDFQKNPLDELIQKDNLETIQSAIRQLPPELSNVLILFYFDDLKYENIAKILDIPLGTVCTRLYQARKELKKALLK